jgi:hypothetical protein
VVLNVQEGSYPIENKGPFREMQWRWPLTYIQCQG